MAQELHAEGEKQEAVTDEVTDAPEAPEVPEAKETLLSGDEEKSSVPEEYDLKLPEGSALADDIVDEIATYARERGLSNEQAQAQLERENGLVAKHFESFQSKQQEVFEQQVEAWAEETKRDPDIGGQNLQRNIVLARRALDRFGSDSLKQSLDSTGFGNRADVIRFLSKIGQLIGDDQFVDGKPPAPKEKPKRAWDILYDKPPAQQSD